MTTNVHKRANRNASGSATAVKDPEGRVGSMPQLQMDSVNSPGGGLYCPNIPRGTRPGSNWRDNVVSFFLGAICFMLVNKSREFQSLPYAATLSVATEEPILVKDGKNDGYLPNHFDASKTGAHAKALNDAMTPGLGYQPTKDRYNSMLPETKGSYWWVNNCGKASVPEAFGIAALNMTYPKEYFSGGGHPNGKGAQDLNYIKYIHRYASLFLDRDVQSLVEFGNGGGFYAEIFHKLHKENFLTVEGSGDGCDLTVQRGVPKNQVIQHDLRHPMYLGRRFDVAVCTEVVEHVEPPFSAQIVLSLVLHADIIWFSFKQVGFQNGAWINHPNERPLKLWKNLFDFYGYDIVKFHHKMQPAVYYRGDFIAYKRNSGLKHISEETLVANLDDDVLNPPEKLRPVHFQPCENVDPLMIAWRGPSASGVCASFNTKLKEA